MEGIYGVKNFNSGESINKDILKKMSRAMVQRVSRQEDLIIENGTGLGAHPIHNEERTVWVCASGRIYNCLELREYLSKKGHVFYTQRDFEILVHLYEEMGEDFVKKISGEFVFVLWDKKNNRIFLVRDQLGVKPLFYVHLNTRLIFASEVRPILITPYVSAKIDPVSLSEYLSFEYVPGPQTIFQGIKKLLPGHILVCKDGNIQIRKYWDFSYRVNKLQGESKICQGIIEHLNQSIRHRLVGNDSKGVLLSGGTDSSSIVALISQIRQGKVKTFSATFTDKAFDESDCSQLISRRFTTDHHRILIKPEQFLESLPCIISSLDEPLADASIIPTYLVTRFAKQKVDICLTGDGGDELFGGYDAHIAYRLQRYYRKLPSSIKGIISYTIGKVPASSNRGLSYRMKKLIDGLNYAPEIAYYSWWGAYTQEDKKRLLSEKRDDYLRLDDYPGPLDYYSKDCNWTNPLEKIFYMDLKFNLIDGSLRKIESMGRLNSLELRYPFLDSQLVKFSASIPSFLKSKGFTTKYIFRKAIKPYLPYKIYRMPKRGFGVPLEDWIRKELKEFILDTLSKSEIERQRFFRYSYVQDLLDEHIFGKQNHFQKIWVLVIFTLWYKLISQVRNLNDNK